MYDMQDKSPNEAKRDVDDSQGCVCVVGLGGEVKGGRQTQRIASFAIPKKL